VEEGSDPCDADVVGPIEENGLRRLSRRYADLCSVCGIELSKGAKGFWDRSAKKVICLACGPVNGETQAGEPGVSAAAEGGRRKEKRVEDVPKICAC